MWEEAHRQVPSTVPPPTAVVQPERRLVVDPFMNTGAPGQCYLCCRPTAAAVRFEGSPATRIEAATNEWQIHICLRCREQFLGSSAKLGP